MNRRCFMKKTVFAGIGLGVSHSPFLALSKNSNLGSKSHKIQKIIGYAWKETIFCQFKDEGLKKELEVCAKELGCKLYFGESASPDIIAVPYFVAIVDRALIGKNMWDTYLDYCIETADDTPLIIVDNLDDRNLPRDKYCMQVYEQKATQIVQQITILKKQIV